jgi:hypothetical protein
MVQAVPFPTVLLDTTETVVTADGQLIQQAPVDGEETLIGVGQGI